MGSAGHPVVPVRVTAVQREIAAWRARKKRGEAMPAELWEAAVDLALESSALEVSRGLSIDYGKLKRLVVEAQECASGGEPEFTELARLFEGSAVAVVEMRRRDGATMRLELPDGSLDVIELTATFLRGAA